MTRLELLIDRLQVARGWTQSLIADIEESRWFEMPGPGVGHPAWQIGHLAASQVALVHMRCFGKKFSDVVGESIIPTFGRGSTPVADKSKYPPPAEIRSMFDGIHEDAIGLISAMKDAELDEAVSGDPHPFFKTKGGAIGMTAMHETFHAGQIAMTRRIFGKAPLR